MMESNCLREKELQKNRNKNNYIKNKDYFCRKSKEQYNKLLLNKKCYGISYFYFKNTIELLIKKLSFEHKFISKQMIKFEIAKVLKIRQNEINFNSCKQIILNLHILNKYSNDTYISLNYKKDDNNE